METKVTDTDGTMTVGDRVRMAVGLTVEGMARLDACAGAGRVWCFRANAAAGYDGVEATVRVTGRDATVWLRSVGDRENESAYYGGRAFRAAVLGELGDIGGGLTGDEYEDAREMAGERLCDWCREWRCGHPADVAELYLAETDAGVNAGAGTGSAGSDH